MQELVTLIACPCDLYWASEIEVQLNNFRKFEHRNVHILVFENGENLYTEYWAKLANRYTEVQFFFYSDPNLKNLLKIYQSVSRPNILKQHFALHPELSDKVILYMDSDVVFTKKPDFDKYLQDNICYVSSTPYIDAYYFEDKRKDVYPFKLKEYDKRDILQELCSIVGIDKNIVITNIVHTGGCQYLLKNVDSSFWESVERDCIKLRMHMLEINQIFFPSEDKGFQSWCADMWAVLWNLWKRNINTKCPVDMDFSWSSDPVEHYSKNVFLHNAGITGKYMKIEEEKVKMFYKSDLRFRTSSLTFFDINDYGNISDKHCSYKYLEEVLSVVDPICKTDKFTY